MNVYVNTTIMFSDHAHAMGIPDIAIGTIFIFISGSKEFGNSKYLTIDGRDVTVGKHWAENFLKPMEASKLVRLLFL